MISFCITACTEYRELNDLLALILKYRRETDEVIILTELGNTAFDVYDLCGAAQEFNKNVRHISAPLNGDFSTYKNTFFNYASNKWIFQLDADELPSEILLQNIHAVLDANPDVELLAVPRANYVEGITEDDIKKWNWKVEPSGEINWPDWQTRIYRRLPTIRWHGVVHERISGYAKFTFLPENTDYCIYHRKTIERQRKQNEFYERNF